MMRELLIRKSRLLHMTFAPTPSLEQIPCVSCFRLQGRGFPRDWTQVTTEILAEDTKPFNITTIFSFNEKKG